MAEKEIKRVITIESSESLNTLNNLNARIQELKGSMGDLDITTEEYRQVSEEVTQLENVKRNAIRGVTAAVEGSYNAYSKELSILQKHRKTLNENTQEYKDMTKRVAELQQKLKDMDADVGVYSRNVGNYSSAFDGLQGSVDNVAKKLPQLASGFAGFAASLVEDLPKVLESLRGIEGSAATAAAGTAAMGTAAQGAAVGIKALIKAMTSWNVILLAIITVLQIFADDIQEWIEGLVDTKKAMTEAERAMDEFKKSIEEQGVAIGDTLVKVRGLKDAWDALGGNLDAKKKYIEENKKIFEELGIAIGKVNEAEAFFSGEGTENYIEAVKARAMAEAARRKSAEYYDKIVAAEAVNKMERERYESMPDKVAGSTTPIYTRTRYGVKTTGYKTNFVTNTEKTALAEEIKARDAEIADYVKMSDALFELAKGYDEAAKNKYTFQEGGGNGGSTSTTSTAASTKTQGMGKDDLIALTGGAIDASAEREALKVTLDARIRMTTANAEEREKIEKELAERLNEIEKARLDLTIVNLEAMLESEMLTNEQRLNIEAELIQAKIDLADMEVEKRKEADAEKLKSEEERAKKEKAVKDKEAKEEAEREKQMQSIKANMLNMTTSLIRQSAELFEEDSKERKALNAAAIVMDTYKAAMAAWTAAQGLPPGIGQAVGAANVAASVAMGAMQLANLFKVAPDGSNAEGALSSAQSAPNVASSMPASYTRSLQGDNELTEMNKDTRVYVVESDITNAQKSARVRVESATF